MVNILFLLLLVGKALFASEAPKSPDQKYVFKSYSDAFPVFFETERERILAHMEWLQAIEHVGSTAIPSLGGKGIIDIVIAVDESQIEAAIQGLQELGYILKIREELLCRFFFQIDLPDEQEGVRRYHVHLTNFGNDRWNDLISFRDYIREHPEEREAYAELKRKAVDEAEGSGAAYRDLKRPFFEKMKPILNLE